MPFELAGIKFKRVHRISTLEQARFIHHRIPGQDGNVTQNLGRESIQLQIEGIFYGPEAKDSLETLRAVHLKRRPVDFVADIMGGSYAGRVTLDRLDVKQAAAEPDQFSYVLIVSEHAPPPKTDVSKTSVKSKMDQSMKAAAQARMKVTGLPDALALGSMPELTNPFAPLNGALAPIKEASVALQESVAALEALLGS